MKKTIERITSTAILSVAFMLSATSAWAAVTKPVAIWHGDFAAGAAGARGGYVINANGNAVAPACITIDGTAGVIVTNNTVTANLETSALGVVARFTGAVYSSTIRALATTITSASTAGSDRGWFGVNNSTQMTSYYYDTNNGGAPKVWNGERYNYNTDYAWPNSGTHYFGCTYSAEDKDGTSGRYGWRSYVDGVLSTWNNGMFSYGTDRYLYGYGFALGGSTTGYQFTDATIDYIAIVRSAYPSDIAYWSLTDMTKTAATFAGSDANTGVNVPASGETISTATAAAAVFVQAGATLGFSGSGSLTIGDGTGPLYVASGATLTIDLNGVTAPTAQNPFVLLVKGQVYGAKQVNFVNVPANTMTSIGEGGTIALLHNSVYTDLLDSWKSNGQKVFAWRDTTGNAFKSCLVSEVDTNTGDIAAETAAIQTHTNGGGFDDKNPGGVLYYDNPAYASSTSVNYSWFTLGGLFVTAGGSSLYNKDQQLKLGDNSNSGKTFHYVFAQSLDLGPFKSNSKLYGPVDLTIYEGATVTLSANGLFLANDAGKVANLKMSGGGVLKTSGTITAESGSNGITLDYSALDVSRTSPFIQGNLSIHDNVKLVLPAALAADTPYQLCSGTLTVGSTSLQKSITVGSNTFLADLTFDTSAKTVSYCPARTTTVSGGTTEWSSLTWANGTGTAGWASSANACITVSAASEISIGSATTVNKLKLSGSGNLTIADVGNLTVAEFDLSDYNGILTLSVDSAATATTWKFTGSADVTITGISDLTLSAFDLSGYTGDLIVDGGLPAAVTLCGGNLVFDVAGSTDISSNYGAADAYQGCVINGTGNVYKRGAGTFYFGRGADNEDILENDYDGNTYIEAGVGRRWGTHAFGVNGNHVYVGDGGSVDIVSYWTSTRGYNYHLAGTGCGSYPAMMQRRNWYYYNHSVNGITLDADATIGGDKDIYLGSWGGSWSLQLNGHRMSKVGSGKLTISDFTVSGEGVVEVAEGTLSPSVYSNQGLNAKLIVNPGTYYTTEFNDVNVSRFVWKEVVNNGTISAGNANANTLYINSSYSGCGAINNLYLKNGVTVKPTSITSGMTISGALTLEGSINVDISDIDLTGRSDLPIITSPTHVTDANVATFTRGDNSSNWELYDETVVADTTYVLGVRLSTITDPVSWNGAGGTWSVNSFNGGTENYSNQALQTVTFADDGESTTTPLAVTVSGEKTVGALNFTADNRNVTLSGDAITAATVSKSGGGVAIVNNVLSGTTLISVTDGVLVLNPNGEAVSDVDSLDDGSLVIYVGAGVTRTVTESISATKIVKRGSGTLKVTAASTSVPLAIDEGVVAADSAPTSAVVVNEGGVFELISTSNVNDSSYGTGPTSLDLSKVTGGGTLKYSSTAGWRAFPDVDARMPASTLTLQTELADSLIITKNNGETVVGSLVGSKNIRSDFGNNGANGRELTVTQSKDTEWQGKFVSNRITKFNVVAPSEGTPGTLTLSGTQELSSYDVKTIPMQVDGSVNLTGTWVGATTVAGTFGGTGTLTGDLALNTGSTFKVWATDGLTATGVLTLPEEGKITVDVSELTIGAQASTTILTVGSGMDLSKFNLVGSNTHFLQKSGQVLNLVPIAARLTNGNSVTPFAGVDEALGRLYSLAGSNSDAYVTVTPGFSSGFTDEELLETYGIFHDTVNGIFGFAAAEIGTTTYVSLSAAVAAASASGDTITLLRDTAEQEIALNNKSITLDESSYTFSGSFTGSGTLVLPEGTLLKSAQSSMWLDGWVGTVWVKGINNICGVDTSGSTLFEPNNYGREGSVLKLSGIKGWIFGAVDPGFTINPTIEIEDATYGYGLWLSDGYGYNGGNSTKNYTILKGLKGTGTLIGNGNGGNVLLQVEGWNDFAGTLTLTNKVVVFGSTLPEEQAHIEGGGYILVKSGESVEVPAGKTWTVGNGVIVNGNLSLGTGAAIVNTTAANTWVKRGTGTITLNVPSDLPATPASDWAGTVVLPVFTAGSGHDLNKYGVEGSKVQLTGITSGWLDMATSTINPEIVLAGNVTLTDSSDRTWTFKKVSGTGNLSLTPGTYKYQITIIINDLASTVGTISNNMRSETIWTIDKISFPAETSLPAGTKILSTGGTGPVIVSGVTVGGVATPIPMKYKEDGVYVGYGTTFTVY